MWVAKYNDGVPQVPVPVDLVVPSPRRPGLVPGVVYAGRYGGNAGRVLVPCGRHLTRCLGVRYVLLYEEGRPSPVGCSRE